MEILKIIAALFMLLVLVACSKPDPLAEAKKNGFSSVAEMNEMKSLGHSTKMGYLLSILPTSGCSSIEELEHALIETGGSCDYWKKYVHASTPLKEFKGKSIFLLNTKILNLISGGDSLDGLALNVSHCAVINYFAYQSYLNGTLLANGGGIDEETIVATKNDYLINKTFFQSLNSNVNFEETGQYFYRTILDNIQDIKNTQGDQNAVKAALKIVQQGYVICAQYLISDDVKSILTGAAPAEKSKQKDDHASNSPTDNSSIKQEISTTADLKSINGSSFSKFKGAWFEVHYPSRFTVKLIEGKSNLVNGAIFTSEDKKVQFQLFSPQWKDGPFIDTVDNNSEKEVAREKKISTQDGVKGNLIFITIQSNDKSYLRSYQIFESDDGSIRNVIGIKYANQADYSENKEAYLKFKKSWRRFSN